MTGAPENTKPNTAKKAESAKEDMDPLPEEQSLTSEADDEIARLNEEVSDLRNRLLRAMADMENLRRRKERELAEAKQYAIADFARDMLVVGDNLQRALSAVSEEDRKNADPKLEALLSGMEMTDREMLKLFEKHSVKRIDPQGEKFDPNFHQAMFEVEHPDAKHGSVVQVVQSGYLIGDRVLRPALVGVAKAGSNQGSNGEKNRDTSETRQADSESSPGSTLDRSV